MIDDATSFVRPVKILLVEDSPGDALMTREAFEDARIAVEFTVAETAEEAIDHLSSGLGRGEPPPDFVLLDLNLPGRPGLDVLRYIRATPGLDATPAIVLTSSKAPEDVLDAYRSHANAFITKPVRSDDFLDAVRAFANFWLGLAQVPRSQQP